MSPEDRAVSPEELRQQIRDELATFTIGPQHQAAPVGFNEAQDMADAILALPAIRRALTTQKRVDAEPMSEMTFRLGANREDAMSIGHNELLRRLRGDTE